MTPTPRARELHDQLGPQLAALRDILNPDNRFDPATSQRHFRILSLDYFEMVVLGPLLARLRQQAPQVVLEILSANDDMPDEALPIYQRENLGVDPPQINQKHHKSTF